MKSIIPGLSFSWKRATGITGYRMKLSRRIGVPTTRSGLQRKIGAFVIKLLIAAIVYYLLTLTIQ